MKILITGGNGFIGTNLVKKLLSSGHQVLVVDNFYSSPAGRVRLLAKEKGYRFLQHDVRIPLKIREKYEVIYHLAAPASPPIYQKDPLFTLETNILGTRNLLRLAQEQKAKMLFSSTSEVYGNPLVHPQKEDYFGNVNPVGPRSCYDEGKRAAETFCHEYFQKGVDVRVIRIFNTYGPLMDPHDGRVVSNFITEALANRDLTIYGNGQQTRSFCYITDLVEGMIKYIELPRRFFGPINLGNPREFTILQLAEKLLKMIPDSKSKIKYNSLPVDDPLKRKPDITLVNKLLDWEPKINLEKGLRQTIDYFKNLSVNL